VYSKMDLAKSGINVRRPDFQLDLSIPQGMKIL